MDKVKLFLFFIARIRRKIIVKVEIKLKKRLPTMLFEKFCFVEIELLQQQ